MGLRRAEISASGTAVSQHCWQLRILSSSAAQSSPSSSALCSSQLTVSQCRLRKSCFRENGRAAFMMLIFICGFFFVFWISFFIFQDFFFIFKLYIIVLVLPNIKMNPPEVYMCSPSWTLLPPHSIPLGRPSAPAPSIQYRASNLDWQLLSGSCRLLYSAVPHLHNYSSS